MGSCSHARVIAPLVMLLAVMEGEFDLKLIVIEDTALLEALGVEVEVYPLTFPLAGTRQGAFLSRRT